MAALVASVSGKVEVARTSATVEEKSECVQQFLHWTMGSPNIYKLAKAAETYGSKPDQSLLLAVGAGGRLKSVGQNPALAFKTTHIFWSLDHGSVRISVCEADRMLAEA